MTDKAREYLGFWGKAKPHATASHAWHPIAYHLLDVAAVADALLRARPLARMRGARLLALEPDDAHSLLIALIALHDIGKFGRAFQAKRPDLWPAELPSSDLALAAHTPHTADGYAVWRDRLRARLGERLWRGGERALDALAPAVFGHHGRPVTATGGVLQSVTGTAGSEAAETCATALMDLLHPRTITAAPSAARALIGSWWVAGLVTVADWVGSHQEWFPYAAPTADIAAYWERARGLAHRAVRDAGLVPPIPAPRRSLTELCGVPEASPAQLWAATVDLPDDPILVVLEDITGSGKTEAAQMLVHRLMTGGRATGAYWAMPTQATANAMYGRQRKMIARLFDEAGGAVPSLALSHGQASLHQGFRATVLGGAERADVRDQTPMSDAELPATVACAAFLADDRRAALLADIGAGTIDQALLGVLPSRYNAVRLFGLADKVLVFDEAHAYDAYVHTELRELLRFQAALGGSAVVLSATLTGKQRADLVEAWTEGLDGGRRAVAPLFGASPAARPDPAAAPYPLATVASRAARTGLETPIAAAQWSRRSVAVRFSHREDVVVDAIVDAARRGAAVAWVRNTVDSCVAAAAALRDRGLSPAVFHARFAQVDRQEREREVLRCFDEKSGPSERRGRVLIATQVIEQSLDLDFDVLASDLAPMDLLVQRAGRLWRHHKRNADRERAGFRPELLVLAPPVDDAVEAHWPDSTLPKTRFVYRRVDVLWRTARALRDAGRIETPGELGCPTAVRTLVETAYGDSDVPTTIREAAIRAEGEERAAAGIANFSTLPIDSGYSGHARGWVDDMRVPTRLGDPETTVRLARVGRDGALTPWASVREVPWKAWALSEVRVSMRRIPRTAAPLPEYQAAVERAREAWGAFERDLPILPLVEVAPNGWEGTLVVPDRAMPLRFRYGPADGLSYIA